MLYTINNKKEWYNLVKNSAKKNDKIILNTDLIFDADNINFKMFINNNVVFDGCNHKILVDNNSSFEGLFELLGGSILNIVLDGKNSILNNSSGWIVDNGSNGTINFCFVKGNIYDNCGGIAGQHFRGQITNCHFMGDINGSNSGGIVAGNYSLVNLDQQLIIESCSFNGYINGKNSGGIIGSFLNNVVINKCFSSGKIIGEGSGGIIGSNNMCIIKSSFSTCVILGYCCGGIIGKNNLNIIISKCFSSGKILGTSSGGLCGCISENNSKILIKQSMSFGDINGESCGGIISLQSVQNINFEIKILNCYTTGNINGSLCGGIIGSEINDVVHKNINDVINIKNCFSSGKINGIQSAGIFGNFSMNLTKCEIKNCISNYPLTIGMDNKNFILNNSDKSDNYHKIIKNWSEKIWTKKQIFPSLLAFKTNIWRNYNSYDSVPELINGTNFDPSLFSFIYLVIKCVL